MNRIDRGQLDENTLRAAVALACRAPSVHNSQPWRWELREHSLHLYADRATWGLARWWSALPQVQHDSWLR